MGIQGVVTAVTAIDSVERRLRFPVDHPDLDVAFYTTVDRPTRRRVGANWTDPDGTRVSMESPWLDPLMDRLERTFPLPDDRTNPDALKFGSLPPE